MTTSSRADPSPGPYWRSRAAPYLTWRWSRSHHRRLSSPPASSLDVPDALPGTRPSSRPARDGAWTSHHCNSRVSPRRSACGSQPEQYERAAGGIPRRESVTDPLTLLTPCWGQGTKTRVPSHNFALGRNSTAAPTVCGLPRIAARCQARPHPDGGPGVLVGQSSTATRATSFAWGDLIRAAIRAPA